MSSNKSTANNTVFVRFIPPSASIERHHLEDFFSNVGPIKKCSLIRNNNNNKEQGGYGFVKFVSNEDAQEAAKTCNSKVLTVSDNLSVKLKVELASNTAKQQQSNSKPTTHRAVRDDETNHDHPTPDDDDDDDDDDDELIRKRKRTCRVIVRNVSFYAKESHIKSVMEEQFGPVVEVTLPRVNPQTHRGFAFVTFQNAVDAQKATQPRDAPVAIKSRPVAIDYSVSKTQHQQQQQQQQQSKRQQADDDDESDDGDEENKEEEEDKESGEDLSGEDDDDDSDSQSDNDVEESDAATASDDSDADREEAKHIPPGHDPAVEGHRTLFIRNLPFDVTRHDVFELLSKYGRIASIYLVKDKMTGVSKGTAFCSFESVESTQKVLDESGTGGDFVSQREGVTAAGATSSSGLFLRGRRLFVDLAVDKKTASTLTAEKREDGTKIHGKDRRNLYLKMEGRVANQADGKSDNLAWESLPESDQLKRQRAFAEKNTKLRSPLFFINPNRLSIRNLAKHVDEADLKKLVVQATRRGLDTNLVSQEDQVAHWRASGEMTTRDIIQRINAAKESNPDGTVIPSFDEKNVKKFIPSVFIDRDFTTNKKEKAPSRGFGFVDFEHHAHALACLRELNNNPYYSEEYVTGGKRAAEVKRSAKRKKNKKIEPPKEEFVGEDGRVQIPRLIVDFTVENKAKAKKQAEHRAQQHANIEKQKLERKEKILSGEVTASKKKKSRGKLQREKKRKDREDVATGGDEAPDEDTTEPVSTRSKQSKAPSADSVKKIKPPKKKRRADKEDEKFESLVDTYRTAFSNAVGLAGKQDKAQDAAGRSQKRWFED